MAVNREDVTAAILAGGLGTRLRSIVSDRPKVLAEVNRRPYLTFLLEQLAAASFREVVLLTGHGAGQVRTTIGDEFAGMRLLYSTEPSPLGTGGAVRWALPNLRSSTVLLLNGDSYCDVDLHAFQRFHFQHGAAASLVLTQVADTARFGSVACAAAGRVRRFVEKGETHGPGWVNAGLYLLARQLIEEIPAGQVVSLERNLFPAWVRCGNVFALRCPGRFLDIGTPEAYAAAERFFRAPGQAVALF